ncbi:coiled-coil domain-containing protein 82 [Hyla sarda]|uniref:coiled-coil domain-containing protein 82 n=1 Tax=Hyla sarda TaxID=327740 RepID=UPI0024C257C7|nr:coiled-coil domain-containing protein 82 [Hyla sarda]XP_056417499.1 coiled-coil domain-containing protein 82 [Hyla sarda]XP_056417500.1 coiled-coil domain-containing protein 82 [Hyla sarda]
MKVISKTYDTRRKRKADESTATSRVDWKRTKRDSISHILDSDESYTSEEEETGEESDDSTEESEDQPEETTHDEEDGDEGRIKKPRLKSRSATIDSESSSDSDGPAERVNVKRSCVIKEEDSDGAQDEETKAHNKKQKRMEKLKALAKKQRSRSRSTRYEETEEGSQDSHSPLPPETPCESEDSGDLSDFIVQDDVENNNNGEAENPTFNYKDLLRKHRISLSDSHDLSSHLQKIIKAFLINIVDGDFLISLYDGVRKKRYAQDMLKSLDHLDNRIIGPRLERLTTSCRWTKKYKERLNSYPELYVKNVAAEEASCEACELHRTCSYTVTLSGQAYDNETLEDDDFLKNDKQKLLIGGVCYRRTEAYHQLRHYKYYLYQRCIPLIDKTKGDSANKIVDLALSVMEDEDFLKKEVSFLEGYLCEADYFQEERLFS